MKKVLIVVLVTVLVLSLSSCNESTESISTAQPTITSQPTMSQSTITSAVETNTSIKTKVGRFFVANSDNNVVIETNYIFNITRQKGESSSHTAISIGDSTPILKEGLYLVEDGSFKKVTNSEFMSLTSKIDKDLSIVEIVDERHVYILTSKGIRYYWIDVVSYDSTEYYPGDPIIWVSTFEREWYTTVFDKDVQPTAIGDIFIPENF